MLNVENVATPLTAFTLVVPASVPPPGSAPSPTVIDPVNPVTTFPASSSAATRTAGIVCPACVVCGCVVNATFVAGGGGAAEVVKVALVAPVSLAALALDERRVRALLMLNVENVATPLTAFTLVVPASVPPPGFAPSATVINPVKPVTTFPASSSADTRSAGIVCPACVVCGCVVNARFVAGGAVILNAVLVAPVKPDALATNV